MSICPKRPPNLGGRICCTDSNYACEYVFVLLTICFRRVIMAVCRTRNRAFKAIFAALALLALVSLGLTAVSRTTLSAEAKANAVSVEIKSFDFNPNRVVVKTGETVRLVVTNNDPTLHTFTVPEAGVDVSVPPGSEKLVEFKAPAPGAYSWYCIPHSDPGPNGRTGMVGVLIVQ